MKPADVVFGSNNNKARFIRSARSFLITFSYLLISDRLESINTYWGWGSVLVNLILILSIAFDILTILALFA